MNVAKNQTNEEENKLNNKRIIAIGLGVAMLVSAVKMPIHVKADVVETIGDSEGLEDDCVQDFLGYQSDGAERSYVVYIDKTTNESNSFSIDKSESDMMYENKSTAIYTADLTDEMVEEINAADWGMHAEPNFMFDAMTDEEENAHTIECELERIKLDKELEDTNQLQNLRESWNIRMVNGNQNVEIKRHTVVAVLDSGVDFMVDAPVEKSVNLVTDEQNITSYMSDMTGHGSAMADVISRMNPQVVIYSVRVLDRDNQAPLSRIIQGISWCMENDVDVINMSFGAFQESEALHQVIEDATEQGIVFVAAAGNSGNQGVTYPAAYDDVLSVGAVDAQAKKTEESAVGEKVDLVAPGEAVGVQSMLGLYTCVGGTSVAAAHVAGAASVLTAQESERDADLVSGLLKESANYIDSQAGYGNGLLDLKYALENYDVYAQMREQVGITEKGIERIFVEKNTADLPVFSEEEVKAEGLWKGSDDDSATDNHYYLAKVGINYANANLTSISAPLVRAYKYGAVAPDCYEMSRLHGGIKSNYITSYRLVTKIALLEGDTSNMTKGVVGQSKSAFEGIKEQISLQGLRAGDKNEKDLSKGTRTVSWAEAIKEDYTGSDARKAKLRRIFIYGMALHAITDTFAHAAYKVENEGVKKIVHTEKQQEDYGMSMSILGADNPNVCPNRFEDAKRAARRVIIAYNQAAVGGLTDFCSVDVNQERDYRLGNLMTCAQKANYSGFSPDELNYFFQNQSCEDLKYPVQ